MGRLVTKLFKMYKTDNLLTTMTMNNKFVSNIIIKSNATHKGFIIRLLKLRMYYKGFIQIPQIIYVAQKILSFLLKLFPAR